MTQIDKLKAYITHLTQAAIGPDGIITKIYRLITLIKYTTREKLLSREEVLEEKDRLSIRKDTYKKQKTTKTLARAITSPTDDTALWLNKEMFAAALREKGGPPSSCIGFVDGTVRPIARPIANQIVVLNGHKVHCLKFQVIIDAYVQYAYQTFFNSTVC